MTVAPSTAWRNRIVGSGEEAPDQLVANPMNWRTHPGAQRDALRGSLAEVGWVQQVLVNKRTGHVVDGHARVEEALSRDEATVPVLYVDLDPEEEALVLATLDPISAMASTDQAKLEELLAGVTVDDAGLTALLGSLAPHDEPQPGLTDPDEIPEVGEAPYVKRGEVYQLGPHRVMCGDSTDPGDVGRLIGSHGPIDLLWTDPPYGVAYQSKLSVEEAAARHRRTDGLEVSNDALGESELTQLLAATFSLARDRMAPGAVYYVCAPSGNMLPLFFAVLNDAKLPLHQQLVWVKDIFVMGRHDYHYRHESILYGWREGAAHYFVADRTQDTVWEVARPRQSPEHPTQKPTALVDRALANSSKEGALVYDPFLGSGTTLISAHSLGRTCFGLEIDPRYAQVSIERWQRHTGQTAQRIEAGDA